jgi:hypothetical protein
MIKEIIPNIYIGVADQSNPEHKEYLVKMGITHVLSLLEITNREYDTFETLKKPKPVIVPSSAPNSAPNSSPNTNPNSEPGSPRI